MNELDEATERWMQAVLAAAPPLDTHQLALIRRTFGRTNPQNDATNPVADAA